MATLVVSPTSLKQSGVSLSSQPTAVMELRDEEDDDVQNNRSKKKKSRSSSLKQSGLLAKSAPSASLRDDDDNRAFGYNRDLPSFMVGQKTRIRRLGENGRMEDMWASDVSERSNRTSTRAKSKKKKSKNSSSKRKSKKKSKEEDASAMSGGDDSSAYGTTSGEESDSSLSRSPKERHSNVPLIGTTVVQQNLLLESASASISDAEENGETQSPTQIARSKLSWPEHAGRPPINQEQDTTLNRLSEPETEPNETKVNRIHGQPGHVQAGGRLKNGNINADQEDHTKESGSMKPNKLESRSSTVDNGTISSPDGQTRRRSIASRTSRRSEDNDDGIDTPLRASRKSRPKEKKSKNSLVPTSLESHVSAPVVQQSLDDQNRRNRSVAKSSKMANTERRGSMGSRRTKPLLSDHSTNPSKGKSAANAHSRSLLQDASQGSSSKGTARTYDTRGSHSSRSPSKSLKGKVNVMSSSPRRASRPLDEGEGIARVPAAPFHQLAASGRDGDRDYDSEREPTVKRGHMAILFENSRMRRSSNSTPQRPKEDSEVVSPPFQLQEQVRVERTEALESESKVSRHVGGDLDGVHLPPVALGRVSSESLRSDSPTKHDMTFLQRAETTPLVNPGVGAWNDSDQQHQETDEGACNSSVEPQRVPRACEWKNPSKDPSKHTFHPIEPKHPYFAKQRVSHRFFHHPVVANVSTSRSDGDRVDGSRRSRHSKTHPQDQEPQMRPYPDILLGGTAMRKLPSGICLYTCHSCRHRMTCRDGTVALRCPHCRSVLLPD